MRILTDSGGNLIGQRGSYPYGESWYETGTLTKVEFTTYERDSESGNDYATDRTYVNRLGRFSSVDPLPGDSPTHDRLMVTPTRWTIQSTYGIRQVMSPIAATNARGDLFPCGLFNFQAAFSEGVAQAVTAVMTMMVLMVSAPSHQTEEVA